VALTFSEGVLLSADSVRVLEPNGKRADLGHPRNTGQGGATATVRLRTGLPRGTYTVAWKVISADSHPVGGAYTFSIGAPSKTTVSGAGPEVGGDSPAGVLYGIWRYVAYAGFTVLVGASVLLTWCWPRGALLRPMRRLVVGGWVAMVISTVALIVLRAPYADGDGLGKALDLGLMRQQLETRPGTALLSRLLLLGAAAVFVAVLFGAYARREDPAERRDLAVGLGAGGLVVATGLACTWSLAEHASVGIQRGLAMPVDVVHLLAAAVWLGGLVALLIALRVAPDLERVAVRRFSALAFTSVCVLVATGIYQAWRQLGGWSPLWDTNYGRLLLVKIGLVLLLVCGGAASRRWTGRLAEAVPAGAGGAAAGAGGAAGDLGVGGTGPGGASGTPGAGRPTLPGARTPEPELEPEPVGVGGGARAAQLERQRVARAKALARRTREADPERAGLRRSVLAEVGIGAVVLGVTTVLTMSQPGRAVEQQRAAVAAAAPRTLDVRIPFDAGGAHGRGTADITLEPATVGSDQLHVQILGPDDRPMDVPEVDVAFTLPSKHLGPLKVSLQRLDVGHFAAESLDLPDAGDWRLALTVRTDQIDETTDTRTVTIHP
jgi:copper transport protein